ncbi:centrosomal protein of 135 kDa [Helicoverpa armigera]|uniref:centrosomal protein of 135 kDa n=1 Tax=Helicoverpa armigera TaxID=29058 RepID=UPI003082FCB5
MGEAYFTLKRKLEDLGYNITLPIDAVPLVECILADLLQTTRSLQHYMDLSKEALMQRDSLMMEAEPYKCDNAKLIQENNRLHKEIMKLSEESLKERKESKRKLKNLSEELIKKDLTISKLQHDLRDLSLRGLCADTLSSRNKSRRRDAEVGSSRTCICSEKRSSSSDKDLTELTQKIQSLEEKNDAYCDEIMVLKSQVENRDDEIMRLNMLLEGGRPLTAISRECCNISSNERIQNLMKDLRELESANDLLKKEIDNGLEKQHEAMLRALTLADKNKNLQEELQKVDTLALKVEEDCNKRLASMTNEVNFLQKRVEGLESRNTTLESQLTEYQLKENTPRINKLQEELALALKENESLQNEIKDLISLNKNLQDKIVKLPQVRTPSEVSDTLGRSKDKVNCPTKSELQKLLRDERNKYEIHINSVQEKMAEIMNSFNQHMLKCKDRDSSRINSSKENAFIRDLHTQLCEKEQKILMLRKEIDELKRKTCYMEENSKQNFKDVISQLNVENAELSKENILLSKQLSQYKNLNSATAQAQQHSSDRGDFVRNDIQKLKDQINELLNQIQLLKKDKQEYNLRYKEALELSEKLKMDLVFKQKEIEHLEEENCSYKMTSRNGKASTEHLKDECNFLRDQLKKLQSDVIKEKTLSSQIKNIQIETERSGHELQNELLSVQKKLSLANDKIESLEKKCKDLQSEMTSVRNDKSNLIENIRKVDQERDKLVMELDHKTETICSLEQKIKSQTYNISKLENEISDLNRKINANKVSEHKLADNETQITFLNGEILRLNKQLDTAVMENKHLQNSLADANGALKLTKIEHEKSRKEVEGLKQQLQHYVAEVRRIEELLSQKEAERSDMLEHFASLSVEANILENTNHSLESESASKTVQLQTSTSRIQGLEAKLHDKDNIIETQASRIATLQCKINSLENEVKLMAEEKTILEQNISYLKQMCSNLQSEKLNTSKGINEADSELKLYENRIKSLSNRKTKLEIENEEMKQNLATTEKLLSNARKEIVELKLVLQDATSETKSLQESVNRLTKRDEEHRESTLVEDVEFELPPIMLDEIQEGSNEDDEETNFESIQKRFTKYSHSSSTL